MFSSRQLKFFLISSVLCGLLLWPNAVLCESEKSENVDRKHQTNVQAAEPQTNTQEAKEPITNLSLDSKIEKIPLSSESIKVTSDKKLEAQQEANEIARLDLVAQQAMSDATFQMNVSAWVQVFIGFVALVLLYLTVRYTKDAAGHTRAMLVQAREATKTAREEFLATHRPKLRVRHVDAHIYFIVSGDMPKAEVVVVNVGDTAAYVTHFGADFARMRHRKWEASGFRSAAQRLPNKVEIGVGQRHTFTVSSDRPFELDESNLVSREVMFVFCIGEVVYEDALGAVRQTGFAREWSDDRESFGKTENKLAEDYEYED